MKKNPGRKEARLRGRYKKPGDLLRNTTHRMRSQMAMAPRNHKVKSAY